MTSHDSFDTALAIIGMSGRFPGASDVDTFWQNIASGTKSIRFYSDEALRAAGVDAALLKNASYVKAAATLEHVDLFDAAFFGYAPREAQITDPQQRFFLECSWEAFESAGYAADTYRGLVGVFAGSGFSTYMLNNLYANPELMDIVDPLQAAIGNDRDALASTVSYKMNLKGPSISVQTFCSTSLVSVHLACQSLLNYECDMALAGGVAIAVPHLTGYLYKEGGIVSPDGECRTFDASAGGSVMGNGTGVVLLKRFSEAVEDGDVIYAVIRGSAVNNDGSVRVSYTAPGLDGQTEVIAEALGHAGVPAETISYIEAHGTATMLGDSVELAAMKKAFGLSTQKKQFCAIGSVKPNVGHLDRASGVAGLIKTSLALSHKLLPPSLNFQQANPEIDLENSPFYVNTQLREWTNSAGTPRRAGVSSFGLGGTNAHVILEEAPLPQPSGPSRPYQLLMISARTATALDAATANLRTYLQQHPEAKLADVAYTLQVGRNAFNHRQALVCRDRDEAIAALQAPAQRANQTFKNRGVAFLFSGVGEQYPGMTHELYRQEATFREAVDRCCHLLRPLMGIDIRETLYALDAQATPIGNGSKAGPDLRALLGRNGRSSSVSEQRLKQTAFIQPALFVLEYALAQLLMQWGIKPQAMIGFSLGEYVVACLAGVLSLEDSLALVARRAQLIQELPEGAMLAVALSEDNVQLFLDDQICLAAVNSPSTCVLAGPVEAIELLEERLSEQEIACRRVDTTHAFHSTMLEPLRASFTELARGVPLREPQIPYISNVTGTWITAAQATDPSYWADHMCQTVRFADGVGHLLQETELALVEIGPGQVLSSFVKQHPACTGERMALILSTLPSMYDRQSDHATLLQALGKLWLGGVKIDWPGFYKGERRQRMALPTYPFERKRYWIEAPIRTFAQRSSSSFAPAGNSSSMQETEQKGKKADRAEWFYLPRWEQIELQDSASPASPGTLWLIFLDAVGIGEAMAGRLEQQGRTVVRVQMGAGFARTHERQFSIRPGERADYVTLCKTLNASHLMPDTVLHCWSVSGVEESIASISAFNTLQQTGFYSLLYLTQALGTQIYGEPLQIIVLSNQMQAVSGTEALQPEKATLLSACKIIPQENLNIVCRSIDLDMGMAVDAPLLDRLFAECTTPTPDLVVAYRDHQRLCQTYHPLRLELPASIPFRHQGVYLITGGLGGVGLVLAEYLARHVQARLVLLGRSGLPARSAWKDWLEQHDAEDSISQKMRQIQAIEAHGSEVELLQADVASVVQLRQAIQRVYERFGTLHGVIHAAGTSTEEAFKTIQEIGPVECEMHFQPKVYGLYALEQVLEGRELDFCLLYSSLSSVLGGLAFAGYTAANIFMDAFVQKHNRTSATPWISANWDTWQIKEEAHGVLGATVALYAMQPAEATEAFTRIVAAGRTHIVNSTGDLSARIQQWIRLKADNLAHPAAKASGAARPALTTPYAPAREDYEQQIVAIWQHVLGIEPIGIYDNFFELGGHSLMGTQLISRLRHAFQVDLPLVMLFDAPTIAELALAIKLIIIEEIDQLDEEEAQSLV